MTVSREERSEILAKVDRLVRTRFFDPNFNGRNWPALVDEHRESIVNAGSVDEFELRMSALLKELGTSHTGFFRRESKVASRNSINATFRSRETADGPRWIFQDVQPGGPAEVAGIRPGDTLLSVDGHELVPPIQPEFRMGSVAALAVVQRNGTRQIVNIELRVPGPKYRECPYAEPRHVSARKLRSDLGVLKVTLFPGIVGVDFAHDVDRAAAEIRDSDRLIVDLRGNPGGGIGGLRLMSYLTPGKLPVGYSLTRRRAEHGYRKEDLPQFRRIPSQKWMLALLLLRFAGRDQSIVVVTEGLGNQRFHRRIVILVNEHTSGAGEMVAGFAKENKLATIVGRRTAGRLLGGEGFKVGGGYIAFLPVGCYLSWGGHRFEGNGVMPDVDEDWSPESIVNGSDNQLNRAVEVVNSL
jgi:carboxyl-terminal processing protease